MKIKNNIKKFFKFKLYDYEFFNFYEKNYINYYKDRIF